MKTLFTSMLLLLGVASAHGQALRNLNGIGTNTTIYNGLTLTNTGGTATITNLGPMLIRVGADAFGSGFGVVDTNGTTRIQLQGQYINLIDTNGNVSVQISPVFWAIGNGALNGATLLTGSTNIVAIGVLPLSSAIITNSSKIFGYGERALESALITNSARIFAYGDGALMSAKLSDNSENVYAFGHDTLEGATIRTSTELFGYGLSALNGAIITNNTAEVFAYGASAMNGAKLSGSFDVFAYGVLALQGATLIDSGEVFAYGANTLANSALTNSSDVYAFGNSTGTNMAGTFTHVFLIGSGAVASGNNQMVFGDSAYTYIFPGVSLIGNGGGLTNLASATNFSSTSVYNFNGKVTFNAVSYNTNLWAGPTNTLVLSTNYQDYITTTDVNITNVGGQLAGQNTWATLTVSNASAGDITVRSTASGLRPQGSGTSAAMVVGAGKEGILSFLSRDFKSTNYVTTAQQ